MVKAVAKSTVEKPPNGETTQLCPDNMEDETMVENTEEVVVECQGERRRRSPRTCVFISLLILVLLVGFSVVYAIEKSNRNKNRNEGWNYGDDYIVVTHPPNLSNTSWHNNNVSWEAQEEIYTLSDAISQDDIMGLRPIFRKDLPDKYVAYWEAKLNGRSGEKYVIISAARQTGDHRLVEQGALPSPSDVLTEQARQNGYGCHKVYRLRPDGLMACEDTDVNRIVAATRSVDTDSWNINWRNLDKQVTRALPGLKKEWDELADQVQKMPEWNRFQWLSMKTGIKPQLTTPAEPLTTEPPAKPTSLETEFNFQVEETEDGFKAELGLRPGDSVRIPLGQGFREVRIKFVGLRGGDMKKTKNWKKHWQKRLCRVLCGVCEGEGYLDMTMVSKRFFKVTKMGDRFIKVKVDADESFVRRHLEGREIRFKVELRTRGARDMIINYGIILGSSRNRRAFSDEYFRIPHEELFPRYRQPHHGQCMSGSGPVAWAKILGYYDNVEAKTSNSKSPSISRMVGLSNHLPLTMDSSVENVTRRIFDKLGSHCSPHGRGVTSPAQMMQIKKVVGQKLKVIHRGDRKGKNGPWTELIINLLQGGSPVIVSKETSYLGEHHYMVVTRIRQRAKYYSFCHRKTGVCSPWTLKKESLMFVHEEDSPGKWVSADTHFVAAIIEI